MEEVKEKDCIIDKLEEQIYDLKNKSTAAESEQTIGDSSTKTGKEKNESCNVENSNPNRMKKNQKMKNDQKGKHKKSTLQQLHPPEGKHFKEFCSQVPAQFETLSSCEGYRL